MYIMVKDTIDVCDNSGDAAPVPRALPNKGPCRGHQQCGWNTMTGDIANDKANLAVIPYF